MELKVDPNAREITVFLVLWLGQLVFFAFAELPPVVLGVLAFWALGVASVLTPLFKSWRGLAAWQTIPRVVEQYIEEKVAISHGDEIVSTGDFQKRTIDKYYTDFQKISWQVQAMAKEKRKEADRLDELVQRWETSRQSYVNPNP